MAAGVILCFLTAIMQSCSYLMSRSYLQRHPGALYMTVYSHLFMSVLAAGLLAVLSGSFTFNISGGNIAALMSVTGLIFTSQMLYFACASEIEASRLSALTGLKLIVLAFLCHALLNDDLSAGRWLAVVLCTLAAVGMNYTGGRISIKGAVLLTMLMVVNACADLAITNLIHSIEGENIVVRSMAAAAMAYLLLGIIALAMLAGIPRETIRLKAVIPYSMVWFGSTVVLYLCFGLVHVLFVNIIVASRGIISVLLGAMVSFWGYRNLEPPVSKAAWARRLVMAILMLAAMVLYSIS